MDPFVFAALWIGSGAVIFRACSWINGDPVPVLETWGDMFVFLGLSLLGPANLIIFLILFIEAVSDKKLPWIKKKNRTKRQQDTETEEKLSQLKHKRKKDARNSPARM
jgi:hypothetical protein